ncbi:hypothetical protein BDQ12DRAFT_669266 [Crucibulum laeve]|uniref:Uncharacterized protein n=1 Tax=Crucibulum laeve TaxID=68775 RepID=A0A5C3LP74_9AGAR|nr:hypothetical protein BDQ12DRAFT_669266 [Crucibulum laeve]
MLLIPQNESKPLMEVDVESGSRFMGTMSKLPKCKLTNCKAENRQCSLGIGHLFSVYKAFMDNNAVAKYPINKHASDLLNHPEIHGPIVIVKTAFINTKEGINSCDLHNAMSKIKESGIWEASLDTNIFGLDWENGVEILDSHDMNISNITPSMFSTLTCSLPQPPDLVSDCAQVSEKVSNKGNIDPAILEKLAEEGPEAFKGPPVLVQSPQKTAIWILKLQIGCKTSQH